ncbi:MAG: DASH family cryptochrome [Thiolinea sp.]
MRGLYWFRNDLRLHDNPALLRLAAKCDELICVYVAEPRWFTWTRFQSKPVGAFRWRFILESLENLQRQLQSCGQRLVIKSGQPQQVIADLIAAHDIRCVGFSHLPATYEANQIKQLELQFPEVFWDGEYAFTLFEPEQLPFEPDDLPKSFTPFRKRVEKIPLLRPVKAPVTLPLPGCLSIASDELPAPASLATGIHETELYFSGGEKAGLNQLRYYLHESGLVSDYKTTRNGLDGWDFSSKLSPWLAQGCLSPRQIMAELRDYEAKCVANDSTYWLYFELLWREYFQWLHYKYGYRLYHPRGIRDVNPLLTFYAEAYMCWREGTTDSPFVNAFMRQLKETGWMSNRGRQIVASYLVNELGVDWRFGAAWFEQQLIDYDPASNWGNWQYLAGVGTDPRGRRAFNITKQQQTYDPERVFTNKYAEPR